MKWNIHYASREFARAQGDPLLATVEAETKEAAEIEARRRGVDGQGAGLWASPAPPASADYQRCGSLDDLARSLS